MVSVLVIDDEEMFCRSLKRLLRWNHIDATIHTEPKAFMEDAEAGAHDALIFDWNLKSCEGTALITRRRAKGDTRPIALTSCHLTEEHGWEHARASGADVYFPKSGEPSKLADAIKALCARPRSTLAEIHQRMRGGIEKPLEERVREFRRQEARRALAENHGDISATARALNIDRKTLRRWLSGK